MNDKWSVRRRSLMVFVPVLAIAIGVGALFGTIGNGKNNVYALESGSAAERSTITVSGKGELKAAPDVAYVNVAVETRALTAKEAQSKNATQFAGLTKLLYDTYKMAAKDVKTTSFNVQPEYTYNNNDGTSKVKGYLAAHSLQITTRDLNGVGKLLDDLSASGVNRVDGVQFDTEKADQYELQTLDKAMANAKAKAQTLAKAAGKELQDVITITQNSINVVPVNNGRNIMMESKAADSAQTTVETGEITLSADITVTYEMK
ncbi:SIMPL domain-containing protein [Paenibacillus solisilvae]|uniref:SIMPL domain-containing protein n=1 Tax=Paenibacillus solisilvae TaxID=2486751 RepID=A0ABW0W4J5_9BACL